MNDFHRDDANLRYSEDGYSLRREMEDNLRVQQYQYYKAQNNPWPESSGTESGGIRGTIRALALGAALLYGLYGLMHLYLFLSGK